MVAVGSPVATRPGAVVRSLARDRGDVIAIVALALTAMVIARVVRHVTLGDVPHVQDEITYTLQARTYLAGHAAGPILLPRAAFNMWFVDDRTTRFGIFPPGWPLLLAGAMRFGLENWLNPALHAATTCVVALLARSLGGRTLSVLAAALYALSPQAIILAASLMSHPLVGACGSVVAYYAFQRLKEPASRGAPLPALAGGGALALTATTRPLCLVVLLGFVAGVLGLSAYRAYRADRSTAERNRGWRTLAREAAAVVLPAVMGLVILGFYNAALTGKAGLFPQNDYFNEHLPPDDTDFFRYHHGCNNLGFGRGCDFSIAEANHTLENALSNTGDNWQAWLRLAGGGPLLFLAALFACFCRGAGRIYAIATAALIGATVLAYSLYWHPGTCFGARFYQLALPAFILAGSIGLLALPYPRVRAALIAAWLGWNAFALSQGMRELSHDYWGTDTRFATLAAHWHAASASPLAHGEGEAVVLVAFAEGDIPVPQLTWTARIPAGTAWPLSMRSNSALALNDPLLQNEVIFAKYHSGLVDEMRAKWQDRAFYVYVASPDPTLDTLVPLDEFAPVAEPMLERPVENFGGYRVGLKRAPPFKKPR